MEKRIRNAVFVSVLVIALVFCASLISIFLSGNSDSQSLINKPMAINDTWYRISNQETLTAFLDGSAGNTNGYLTKDFDVNWGNMSSPHKLMSGYTLDGNGHILNFPFDTGGDYTESANRYASGYSANGSEAQAMGLLVWQVEKDASLQNISMVNSGYKGFKLNKESASFGAVGINYGKISNVNVTLTKDMRLANSKSGGTASLWLHPIVGGIAGINGGNIFNVKVTLQNATLFVQTAHALSAKSYGFAGGVVGKNVGAGVIKGASLDFVGSAAISANGISGGTGSNNNYVGGFVGYNEATLQALCFMANPYLTCVDSSGQNDISNNIVGSNIYKMDGVTSGGNATRISRNVAASWEGENDVKIVLTPVKAKATPNEIVWNMEGQDIYRNARYCGAYDIIDGSGALIGDSEITYGQLGKVEYSANINQEYNGIEQVITAKYVNGLLPLATWKTERLFFSTNTVSKTGIQAEEFVDVNNHYYVPQPTETRSLIITPKTLSYSEFNFTVPTSKIYDGAKGVIGEIKNDFVGSSREPVELNLTAAYLDEKVMSGNKIVITFSSKSSNYQFAPNNANVEVRCSSKITAKEVTVKVNEATKIFGENDPTFTATWSGFVDGENEKTLGLLETAKFSCSDKINAGSRPLTVTNLSSQNYTFFSIASTFTINKKNITVTTKGSNIYNAQYTVEGLVGSDKINELGNGTYEVTTTKTINFAAPSNNYNAPTIASFEVVPFTITTGDANITAIADGVTMQNTKISISKRITEMKVLYTLPQVLVGHLPSLKFVGINGNFDTTGEASITNKTVTYANVTNVQNLANIQVGDISRQSFDFSVTAEENGSATVNEASACSVAYGNLVAYKAIANANYHFVGWYDGSQVVSYMENFTIKSTKNTALVAKFAADGEVKVQFLYVDGSVYKTIATTSSEPIENLKNSCAITEPQLYQHFVGWNVKKQTSTLIVFEAMYEADSNKNVNITINGVETAHRFNQIIMLEPKFQNSYWTVNGIGVQNGGTFKFCALNEVVIEEIETISTEKQAEIKVELCEDKGAIYFTSTAFLSEKNTLLGFGMLLANSLVENIELGADNVFEGAAQGKVSKSFGQFVMKVDENAFQLVPKNNFKACAYVTYRDASGNIINVYSQILTYVK